MTRRAWAIVGAPRRGVLGVCTGRVLGPWTTWTTAVAAAEAAAGAVGTREEKGEGTVVGRVHVGVALYGEKME